MASLVPECQFVKFALHGGSYLPRKNLSPNELALQINKMTTIRAKFCYFVTLLKFYLDPQYWPR